MIRGTIPFVPDIGYLPGLTILDWITVNLNMEGSDTMQSEYKFSEGRVSCRTRNPASTVPGHKTLPDVASVR